MLEAIGKRSLGGTKVRMKALPSLPAVLELSIRSYASRAYMYLYSIPLTPTHLFPCVRLDIQGTVHPNCDVGDARMQPSGSLRREALQYYKD